MANNCLNGQEFAGLLVSQEPVYDKEILADIRPEDGWIGHMEAGVWEAYSSTSRTKDRFRAVYPNTTAEWTEVNTAQCVGTPCDPVENRIGMGWDRLTYVQEQQSWGTDLFCFDQILTRTQAKAHFAQIISDVLKPATSAIQSQFMRKRMLQLAGKKWVADASMTDFTFTWTTTGGNEATLNTTADPTSKLTPQMLQRRVSRLRFVGYFGRMPFKDMPPLIELVTDDNTLWDLDKAAQDANVNDRWRFTEWDAANKFYRYNFGGQIGNYVTRVDPFSMRFNKVSTGVYTLVLPYVNNAATHGIGSEVNPAFELAQYQMSFISHRRGMRLLTATQEAVNALMPFANRNLGGKWYFAMDNLGEDCNGRAIENKRRNKGQFIADFVMAAEPQYTEFIEAIFHKREPAVIAVIGTCASDPGNPTQDYNSSNDRCPGTSLLIEPDANSSGNYVIAANTVTCGDTTETHAAIDVPDLPSLVNQLNSLLSVMGVWILSGTNVLLTESSCEDIEVPFVT